MNTLEDHEHVDALLAGKVAVAHVEAEETYYRRLGADDGSPRAAVLVAAANARAEGLGEAVAILTGGDVHTVRARAAERSKARRAAGLAGVAGARRALGDS